MIQTGVSNALAILERTTVVSLVQLPRRFVLQLALCCKIQSRLARIVKWLKVTQPVEYFSWC